MLVYLAHPIDQVHAAEPLINMVGATKRLLCDLGISAFQPGDAYRLAKPTEADLRTVASINQNAVWRADALLAVLPENMATLGVPAEIELALTLNRPTVIVTSVGLAAKSVQIANWIARGAHIFLASPEGTLLPREATGQLTDALRSLPDPTKIVLSGGTNDLLVQRGPDSHPLTRAYQGDAGLDLSVAGGHDVRPFEYAMLPTGIRAAIPDGYWGMITGRSSAWFKHRIEVKQAVIDSGYRGELMIGMTWKPEPRSGYPDKLRIPPGMRLAQYVLLPVFGGQVTEVDELPGSERGEQGYGSSGGHGEAPPTTVFGWPVGRGVTPTAAHYRAAKVRLDAIRVTGEMRPAGEEDALVQLISAYESAHPAP